MVSGYQYRPLVIISSVITVISRTVVVLRTTLA